MIRMAVVIVLTAALFLGGCVTTTTGATGGERPYGGQAITFKVCPCLDITVVNAMGRDIEVEADGDIRRRLRPGGRTDLHYKGYASWSSEIAVVVFGLDASGQRTGETASEVFRAPRKGQYREVWTVRRLSRVR